MSIIQVNMKTCTYAEPNQAAPWAAADCTQNPESRISHAMDRASTFDAAPRGQHLFAPVWVVQVCKSSLDHTAPLHSPTVTIFQAASQALVTFLKQNKPSVTVGQHCNVSTTKLYDEWILHTSYDIHIYGMAWHGILYVHCGRIAVRRSLLSGKYRNYGWGDLD